MLRNLLDIALTELDDTRHESKAEAADTGQRSHRKGQDGQRGVHNRKRRKLISQWPPWLHHRLHAKTDAPAWRSLTLLHGLTVRNCCLLWGPSCRCHGLAARTCCLLSGPSPRCVASLRASGQSKQRVISSAVMLVQHLAYRTSEVDLRLMIAR